MNEFDQENRFIEVRVFEEQDPIASPQPQSRPRRERRRPVRKTFQAIFSLIASVARIMRESNQRNRARMEFHQHQQKEHYRQRMATWEAKMNRWSERYANKMAKDGYGDMPFHMGFGCKKKPARRPRGTYTE